MRHQMFLALFLALTVLVFVAFAGDTAAFQVKDYSMVLVGGGLQDDNAEVWDTIVALGGGKGVARFGVVSAASGDPCCGPDSSWVYYRDLLTRYGAAEVYYLPITADDAQNNTDPAVLARISSLSGFFFGGGDQLRIVEAYFNPPDGLTRGGGLHTVPSPALLAIKQALLSSGGVVAGTSAGTDVQTSRVMITGGDSTDALRFGTHTLYSTVERPAGDDEEAPSNTTGYGPGGLGMFEFGLLDTHFENRGRQGRLLRLLADTAGRPTSALHAFGVDENTALVVTTDRQPDTGAVRTVGRVLGERGVMLLDISGATITPGRKRHVEWSIAGARLSHLTAGDAVDLRSFVPTPAAFKTPMAGRETHDKCCNCTSDDVFGGEFQFNGLAWALFDAAEGGRAVGWTAPVQGAGADGEGARYQVEMRRDGAAAGFEGVGPSGRSGFSYVGLRVDMHPEMLR